MSTALPIVYLARHGETAWTVSGQHTGLTDLPLTPNGERNARRLGERLMGQQFTKVFTSPLQRAARTCELAGFEKVAETDDALVEWDYGEYEGLRTADILARRPDWDLFRDGCPGGESPVEIARRADSVVERLRDASGNVLSLFERTLSAHTCRALGRFASRIRGQAFRAEHRKPERVGLRTPTLAAGDPFMERRSPSASLGSLRRRTSR